MLRSSIVLLVGLVLGASTAGAQCDLTGEWRVDTSVGTYAMELRDDPVGVLVGTLYSDVFGAGTAVTVTGTHSGLIDIALTIDGNDATGRVVTCEGMSLTRLSRSRRRSDQARDLARGTPSQAARKRTATHASARGVSRACARRAPLRQRDLLHGVRGHDAARTGQDVFCRRRAGDGLPGGLAGAPSIDDRNFATDFRREGS